MSVEELYMASWMQVRQFLAPTIRTTKENDPFDDVNQVPSIVSLADLKSLGSGFFTAL